MGYMIIDARSQQVGGASSVPILELKKGERISYFSDLLTDSNDRGLSKHDGNKLYEQIKKGECVANIKTENNPCMEGKYWHTFNVVGTDPLVVNEKIEELLQTFGQTVVVESKDIEKRFYLPSLKSFWERFVYLWKWLIFGKTEEETETKTQTEKVIPKIPKMENINNNIIKEPREKMPEKLIQELPKPKHTNDGPLIQEDFKKIKTK